jgi:hypothetical protein
MAEFSKQYCELHNMGSNGDFDVYEEFDKLGVGNFIPVICEGFGFVAIGKFEDDPETVKVYFREAHDSEDGTWVDFYEVLDDERQSL